VVVLDILNCGDDRLVIDNRKPIWSIKLRIKGNLFYFKRKMMDIPSRPGEPQKEGIY
jgi:hypothetical protein